MTAAVWVLGGGVILSLLLLFVYCVGVVMGEHKTNRYWRQESAELDTEWRRLFTELGADHGVELAKADAAIRRLHAERDAAYDAGFIAAMNAKEPTP